MFCKSYFDYLVWREALYRPSFIRCGQAVFNTTEKIYGVAREVQFNDRIDCFYDDSQIEAFLDAAYQRYLSFLENN
jgi:hypothetical protein